MGESTQWKNRSLVKSTQWERFSLVKNHQWKSFPPFCYCRNLYTLETRKIFLLEIFLLLNHARTFLAIFYTVTTDAEQVSPQKPAHGFPLSAFLLFIRHLRCSSQGDCRSSSHFSIFRGFWMLQGRNIPPGKCFWKTVSNFPEIFCYFTW